MQTDTIPARGRSRRARPRETFVRKGTTVTPRVLLTRREAATALGVSLSHFQRHVQATMPCVYSGQLRLYRPEDLEAWAERAAVAPIRPRLREATGRSSSSSSTRR